MTKKKSKRFADAASIVGDELANELEAKSQELVGRSGVGIDPAAVILKDENAFPPGEEEEEEEGMATGTAEEEEEEEPFEERAYGGALTLNQAESFLVREKGDSVLLGDWDILAGVLTNIAGTESGPAIVEELKQFQSRIDVMAVKALAALQQKEATMPEDEVLAGEPAEEPQVASDEEVVEPAESEASAHLLDESLLALKGAFDEALATPVDENSKLMMVQDAFNAIGLAIKANISEGEIVESDEPAPASGGVTLEQIQQVVQSVVAPIQAKLVSLEEKDSPEANDVPARRAVSAFEARSSSPDAERLMARHAPAFDETRPASEPAGRWHMPEQVDKFSGGFEGQTPKLKALIRRTVGIR